MKTIDEIRRDNIAILVEEHGGVKSLAVKLEKSEAQVSQWLNGSKDSKTGKQRGMNSDTSRSIEEKAGKERGWMDHEHKTDVGYIPKSKKGEVAARIVDALTSEAQQDKAIKIVTTFAEPEGNGGDAPQRAAQ